MFKDADPSSVTFAYSSFVTIPDYGSSSCTPCAKAYPSQTASSTRLAICKAHFFKLYGNPEMLRLSRSEFDSLVAESLRMW